MSEQQPDVTEAYLLIQVKEPLLTKLLNYLKRLKIWHKLLPRKYYDVQVTAEDRLERLKKSRRGNLNPPAAWETCRHCAEIWDWDPMGRGPDPLSDSQLRKPGANQAPRGKGWVETRFGSRQRVAGECKNPLRLNFFSCPKWCLDYEPTTVEGLVWLMERTAEEHEQRVQELRGQIAFLQESEIGFEEAIATGRVWDYKNGRFALITPDE